MPSNTKLSSSVTIGAYKKMVEAEDVKGLGRFIRERFDERYFLPVDDHSKKHGFASLAIACLMIETLESFYKGEARNGWRVLRKGALLDREAKSINATKVLRAVRDAVHDYSGKLGEEPNWTNFKKKMAAICKNCE